jgi:hypothetical protein
MDLYSSNASISFIKPEMMNLFKYLFSTNGDFKRRFPDIGDITHCNIIDIDPKRDLERLRIIAKRITSIECLEDQLMYVRDAKILTLYVSGNKDTVDIDNRVTKLILIIGNVSNIRLTVDDSETIVFHRTFGFADESGLVIGDKFDDLKPTYHLFSNDNPYPEVFPDVAKYGIVMASERNRQSLLSGSGYSYILDTKLSLNAFREASIVAFRNNSVYEPEVTANISVVHGHPEKFKSVVEAETKNPREVIMVDMSHDDLKSFVEHPKIKSYEASVILVASTCVASKEEPDARPTTVDAIATVVETTDVVQPWLLDVTSSVLVTPLAKTSSPKTLQGYSIADGLSKSISPARHILNKFIRDDQAKLDELAYKVDNPFTFAFVKKRNHQTYQLFLYNIISNGGEAEDDNTLIPEKLRILLASKREKELDLFKEQRYRELVQGSAPSRAFLREYPRIDAFSTKRNAIRTQENSQIVSEFCDQKKSFGIESSGSYLFESYGFLVLHVATLGANANIYIRECGLVFVKSETPINLHIVGNVHTIFAAKETTVTCYCIPKQDFDSYLFCTENETDEIGRFFDNQNIEHFEKLYKEEKKNIDDTVVAQTVPSVPDIAIAKIKSLYCDITKIVGRSLVHIDSIQPAL